MKSSINNTYSEKDGDCFKRLPHYSTLAEWFLQTETKKRITEQIENIKEALMGVFCYNATLDMIGDKFNIDGLEVFKSNITRFSGMIEFLNYLFTKLHNLTRSGKVPGELPAEELNAALKELLKPIKIRELMPNEEIIARFRDELTLDVLEKKRLSITDEFIQAVKDRAEEV